MDRWHGPADAILGAHRPDAPFPAREGFISTTAAFISASAGASVGQYGPVLHFGASVGAQVRALFPTRLTPDIYLACGVAAAISAGFGAPIAAVVLVSEAVLRHFAVRAVAPITVSAIVAAAVTPLFFDRVSPYSVTAVLRTGPDPCAGPRRVCRCVGYCFYALAVANRGLGESA